MDAPKRIIRRQEQAVEAEQHLYEVRKLNIDWPLSLLQKLGQGPFYNFVISKIHLLFSISNLNKLRSLRLCLYLYFS